MRVTETPTWDFQVPCLHFPQQMFYICLVGTRNLLGCDDLGCWREPLQTWQVFRLHIGEGIGNAILSSLPSSFLPSFSSFPPTPSFSPSRLPIPLSPSYLPSLSSFLCSSHISSLLHFFPFPFKKPNLLLGRGIGEAKLALSKVI